MRDRVRKRLQPSATKPGPASPAIMGQVSTDHALVILTPAKERPVVMLSGGPQLDGRDDLRDLVLPTPTGHDRVHVH